MSYKRVLRKDPCAYCGGPSGTIDHITPRSQGGPNRHTNLAAACQRCNSRKADRSLLTFLTLRARRQAWR